MFICDYVNGDIQGRERKKYFPVTFCRPCVGDLAHRGLFTEHSEISVTYENIGT